MKKKAAARKKRTPVAADYGRLIDGIGNLLETARSTSARAVNAVMTETYWEIGRRVVEFEQGGMQRAEYGKSLLLKLSRDLSAKFARGFSPDNLESMRIFYQSFAGLKNSETMSRNLVSDTSESLVSKLYRINRENPRHPLAHPGSFLHRLGIGGDSLVSPVFRQRPAPRHLLPIPSELRQRSDHSLRSS